MVSLLKLPAYYSVCLSATNGYRVAGAVKVGRKIEADSFRHNGKILCTLR